MTGKAKRRRRMLSLKMEEISGVDRPAQEGANMVLLKREDVVNERAELAKSGAAMPDGSFPIVTKQDLEAAIEAFPRAKNPEATAKHIAGRAEAISATDTLPTSGDLADFLGKAADSGDGSEGDSEMSEATNQADIAAVEKRAERAEAIADLSVDQLTYVKGLDAAGQDAFLAMGPAKRDDAVSKAAEAATAADPVVYESDSGQVYRKSDDMRLVEMAKERDSDRKELAESRALSKRQDLEKRATNGMNHFKGDIATKASLLGAIDGIEDADVRKAALSLVEDADSALSKAFETLGVSDAPVESSAESALNKLATERASADGTSFAVAYSKVLDTVEGQRLYGEIRS